ncbi:MAG: methyltransferase domain-containing protein [Hyphomicrobiaceae bacterium]
MTELKTFQKFYAAYVTASVGVTNPRIVKAFASVPREDFLGPGPWEVNVDEGYILTPSADPALIYQDIVVALAPDRRINNGEPSLHARMLDAVSPKEGDRVLQVGCGSGYYTALLAELVGASGRVTAMEIDPEMAVWAQRTLADRPNVTVICRSGIEPPLPESDIIYVSAGASEPVAAWRNALSASGRLLFPLTPGWRFGALLLVVRTSDPVVYGARFVTRAGFIPCAGAQSEPLAERLHAAFEDSRWADVRTLRIGSPPDKTCWLAGDGWWLSTQSR